MNGQKVQVSWSCTHFSADFNKAILLKKSYTGATQHCDDDSSQTTGIL